jgi:hypothetical protein
MGRKSMWNVVDGLIFDTGKLTLIGSRLEESEYPNLYKTKSGIFLLADESNSEQDGEAGMICP